MVRTEYETQAKAIAYDIATHSDEDVSANIATDPLSRDRLNIADPAHWEE
jgi:hypothetical protein